MKILSIKEQVEKEQKTLNEIGSKITTETVNAIAKLEPKVRFESGSTLVVNDYVMSAYKEICKYFRSSLYQNRILLNAGTGLGKTHFACQFAIDAIKHLPNSRVFIAGAQNNILFRFREELLKTTGHELSVFNSKHGEFMRLKHTLISGDSKLTHGVYTLTLQQLASLRNTFTSSDIIILDEIHQLRSVAKSNKTTADELDAMLNVFQKNRVSTLFMTAEETYGLEQLLGAYKIHVRRDEEHYDRQVASRDIEARNVTGSLATVIYLAICNYKDLKGSVTKGLILINDIDKMHEAVELLTEYGFRVRSFCADDKEDADYKHILRKGKIPQKYDVVVCTTVFMTCVDISNADTAISLNLRSAEKQIQFLGRLARGQHRAIKLFNVNCKRDRGADKQQIDCFEKIRTGHSDYVNELTNELNCLQMHADEYYHLHEYVTHRKLETNYKEYYKDINYMTLDFDEEDKKVIDEIRNVREKLSRRRRDVEKKKNSSKLSKAAVHEFQRQNPYANVGEIAKYFKVNERTCRNTYYNKDLHIKPSDALKDILNVNPNLNYKDTLVELKALHPTLHASEGTFKSIKRQLKSPNCT
ncbi:DEAD/DEAH box helicase family protein [Flammeovirga yaeyamensis]|uniref:DEAD/DEAH box helicase family protein n=1 Tax=Flammeovirga yaeyamensis TaxID=367791 RepID=A0AAX1NE77_9BACT|nr:DEAD/DEAH box helicase family protein [Flammeovirga yaeyamensis]MBB3700007.1 nucleoside-triphosphatase THEP1 [Flammeovirga yaeyamensis]NMF37555.1 DEAD/DEAH box helicase family protein [Flammeovirga yaeyamensis]QWG04612.1 DEAD/DEAH box helicase family protein [Flammeovirga yaeyamensis]